MFRAPSHVFSMSSDTPYRKDFASTADLAPAREEKPGAVYTFAWRVIVMRIGCEYSCAIVSAVMLRSAIRRAYFSA